jgi:hypothetical protein
MRIALLGADEEALALVRHAVLLDGHALVAACDVGPWSDQLPALAPGARLEDNWESLVLGSMADAVIVARGLTSQARVTGFDDVERRADQLRKLAAAAVPLLVVAPASEAIVGFEIEMIRRDVGGTIVPYSPGRQHPALDRLSNWLTDLDESPVGPIEQILLERQQGDRSRGAVLVQLARDAAIVRRLVGDIRAVSASGPPREAGRDPLGPKPTALPPLANLSVTIGGQLETPVRWSIGPVVDTEGGRLVLVGQRGRCVLHMPEAGPWRLELPGAAAAEIDTQHAAPHVEAEAVLADLKQRMLATRSSGQEAGDGAWLAACRDQEVAEAVDRSLARGRTIELFNEQHTEEESFKGVMAMGGCLLLSATLVMVFVVALVEGLQLPLREMGFWQAWPLYVLLPLGVFLLLQLLGFAVKKEAAPGAASGPAASLLPGQSGLES